MVELGFKPRSVWLVTLACNGLEQVLASQPEMGWATVEKHQILATRQWSVTRTLVLQFCRKDFPQIWKVVKQIFIPNKSTVHVEKHMGGLRGIVPELLPRGSLNHLCGALPPDFLWPIIFICLVHSPCLVYLRILPSVRTHLLAKMDPTEKASG